MQQLIWIKDGELLSFKLRASTEKQILPYLVWQKAARLPAQYQPLLSAALASGAKLFPYKLGQVLLQKNSSSFPVTPPP